MGAVTVLLSKQVANLAKKDLSDHLNDGVFFAPLELFLFKKAHIVTNCSFFPGAFVAFDYAPFAFVFELSV